MILFIANFETRDLIAIAAILLSLVTLIDNRRTRQEGKSVDHENRLTALETKVSLFWMLMETKAAEILHKPIHFERDKLIEKFLEGLLTDEESSEFEDMLAAIWTNKSESPGDRVAAALLASSIEVKKRVGEL